MLLLGDPAAEVPDRYASTSPIELTPIGMPQLIVHGAFDTIVPYVMRLAYARAAQASGDRVELVTVDGADHLGLWNPASAAFERVVEAATTFVDDNGARGRPQVAGGTSMSSTQKPSGSCA